MYCLVKVHVMSLVVFGWELHHQQIPRFQAAPASPDYVQISSRDRGSFRANVGPPRRLEQDACFAGLQLGASFVSHTHTPTHLPKTIFLCLLYSSIYHHPTLLISRQTHVAHSTHERERDSTWPLQPRQPRRSTSPLRAASTYDWDRVSPSKAMDTDTEMYDTTTSHRRPKEQPSPARSCPENSPTQAYCP